MAINDVLMSAAAAQTLPTLDPRDIIAILGFVLGGSGIWGVVKWRQERKLGRDQAHAGLITANTEQWDRLLKSVNSRVEDLEGEIQEVRALVDYLREVKRVDDAYEYDLTQHIYRQEPPPPPKKPPVPQFDAWRERKESK
jgi:hypothetical protein